MPARSTTAGRALGGAALVAALALAGPFLGDYGQSALILIGIDGMAAVGLTLLAGYAGQVSLGHIAFAGIGGYTSAILSARYGVSPWLGILLGMGLAGLVAGLTGIPLLRLRGHYLALGTLGFGLIVHSLMKELVPLTGGPSGFTGIPYLSFFGVPLDNSLAYYWLVLACTAGVGLLLTGLVHSRIGRLLRAMRDSEIGAEMTGIDARRHKLGVFVISAMCAALAGGLYVHFVTFVSPAPFDMLNSIKLLVIVTLGGLRSVWGAWVGAALLTLLTEGIRELLPHVIRNAGGEQQMILYGVLVVLVLIFLPGGVTGAWAGWRRRARGATAAPPDPGQPEPLPDPALTWASLVPAAPARLEVRGATVAFSGVTAVKEVHVQIQPGQITALIGPNGAGKTTLFNLICGLVHPIRGDVAWGGRSLKGLGPSALARMGMGRTFQNIRLFGQMTALENVMVGLEARRGHGYLASMLRLPAAVQAEARARARGRELLALVGLAEMAGVEARHLPFGQQRLLEIARALATGPSLVLLDEPASGLTSGEERAALASIIRAMKAAGIGVVLVEHDMRFVMSLADHVVVLHHGERIAEGTPAQIHEDPRVVEAYLGDGALVRARAAREGVVAS